MSGKARPIGHAGDVVRSNIRRIRNTLGISQERLSELLSEVQNPIATVGVWRLENGARQVTIDDLFAIAKVLGVKPADLLEEFDDDRYREDCLRWLVAEIDYARKRS